MRRFIPFLLAWSAAISGQPAPVENLLKQAIGLHQAGHAEQAIPVYEKYLAQRPDSPLGLSNLGAAYSRVGRYEDAIVQYTRALKAQPGNLPVELNLGLVYYKTGQLDRAVPLFQRVQKAAPDQPQATLLLADCWLSMGQYKEVDSLLSPLFDKNQGDLAVAYLLGTALIRDGQAARGQVVIDRILSKGESAEARLLLGATKLNAQDYPAALADLDKATSLNPNLPDVHAYHGQALQATGDPAGAMAAYRKALTANGNNFTANLELGVLLKDERKLDESLIFIRRALKLRPMHLDARYQLASVDFLQDRVDPARVQLEALVKEAPAFTAAHVTLATVYYRLKRKADGDRERAIVRKLTAETQARQQQGINIK